MSRQSATRPEVRVGGHWMSSVAPWGGLRHSTNVHGSLEVSWTVAVENLGSHWRHPALVYGAPVELHLGPIRLWVGTLNEPDWDSGQMVATGASRDSEECVALDSGIGSTKPNNVIDDAMSRGRVTWTARDDFGTTAVGNADDTGGLVSVNSVLEAWAQANASGWAVDMNRRLVIRPVDETTPTWHIVPGSGVLGSAADDRVDAVVVRYVSTTSGTLATATYEFSDGLVERPVDLTDRGYLTSAQVDDIIAGMRPELQGRSGWTNGLTLTAGQVTTRGGVPADLALIKGGDTVRLLGVPDPRGVAHNLDVVLADTDYDWTEDTIQINPVGRAARDENSVLEEIGDLAVDAMTKATSRTPGPARASGTVAVSVSAATTGSASVSFPADRFAVTPQVTATVAGSSVYFASTSSTSASGTTITVRHYGDTSTTTTVNVRWIAEAES